MFKVIIVIGLPGAGKTSVLNGIKEKRKDIEIINFGDIISKIAIEKKLVKHRDEINFLPVKEHKNLQSLTIDEIKKIQKKIEKKDKKLIIDTHAVMRKREGFFPGIPPKFLKLKIDAFIFIDAPSSEIIERRKKDLSRKREIIGKEEIDQHRNISIALISAYSSQIGAPFFIIQNKNGKLNESIEKLNFILDYL